MYAKKTGKRVKYIGLLRTNQECQKKIKMGIKIDNAQESTKAQVTQHNDNDTKTCICTLIRQKIYRFLRTEKKSLAGEAILKSLSSNDNFIVFVAMWTSR
jgi:hypothetical protein